MKNQYIFGGEPSPNEPRCAHLAARQMSVFARAFANEFESQSLLAKHRTSPAGALSPRFSDGTTVDRISRAVTRAHCLGNYQARGVENVYVSALAEGHERQAFFFEQRTSVSSISSRHSGETRTRKYFVLPDASAGKFRKSSALGVVLLPHRALLDCMIGKGTFRGLENPPQVVPSHSLTPVSLPERGANRQPLFDRARQ